MRYDCFAACAMKTEGAKRHRTNARLNAAPIFFALRLLSDRRH